MNRKIKFRLWDKENNCWYQPTYEAYKGNLEEVNIGLSGDLFMRTFQEGTQIEMSIHESRFPDRFILEQFTGLLDKNEKEIYEGDVISALGAYVLWDSELACWCFNFKEVDTPSTPLFYRDTISKCEVIGNIHESNTVEH